MSYWALIPAAGQGTRMQSSFPKQYLPLCDRPLLWHTIASLSIHPAITDIALILSPNDRYFNRLDYAQIPNIDKLHVYYCGGETRAQSVCNGLSAIASKMGPGSWILVHDAARPCLSFHLLQRLIEQVYQDEVGGILALPISDTIKAMDHQKKSDRLQNAPSRIIRTVPRTGLWLAHTPQMFRYHLLYKALLANSAEQITDEASALEAQGYAPILIQSSPYNLKVTYQEDLALAKLMLSYALSEKVR